METTEKIILSLPEIAKQIGRNKNHTSTLLTLAKDDWNFKIAGHGKYYLEDNIKSWINMKAGYPVYAMPYDSEWMLLKTAHSEWEKELDKELKYGHFMEIMLRREKDGLLEIDHKKQLVKISQFLSVLQKFKEEKSVKKIYRQAQYVPGELSANYVRRKEIVEFAVKQKGISQTVAKSVIKQLVAQKRLKKIDHGTYSRKDFESLKKDLIWTRSTPHLR